MAAEQHGLEPVEARPICVLMSHLSMLTHSVAPVLWPIVPVWV